MKQSLKQDLNNLYCLVTNAQYGMMILSTKDDDVKSKNACFSFSTVAHR